MILAAIEHLRTGLQNFLRGEVDVHIDYLSKIHEGKAKGLFISLINVDEETSLKNSNRLIRDAEKAYYREPSIFLNLHLLLSFNFSDYGTGLKYLSDTVQYFQETKHLLVKKEGSNGGFKEYKMVIELQKMSIEQLNHIWGISGGAHCPALLYRVRVVELVSDQKTEAPEIEVIQIDSDLLR